ncbi:MAG: ABC transporter permease [Anaerolineae bacterium]|nr:ABC transporter permease [Anaerolineae bacterium]MDW8173902.1 ABC transporter permease [Anaerolineae bacterium]
MASSPAALPSAVSSSVPATARRDRDAVGRALARLGFTISSLSGYFFLWAPIVLLILFSFNDGRSVNTWFGFTTRWYEGIFDSALDKQSSFQTAALLRAVGNSLLVGLASTAIACALGTTVALSLARGTFPGRRWLDALLLMTVIFPEITQGISLAIFFKVAFDGIGLFLEPRPQPGFGTIIIGHVVFTVSYVAIVVRARLADMNPRLDEAAADLGADGWTRFWLITFPLILPGIVAGALLAFTLSLDDFVVTFFLSGVGTTTLPVFVYGLLKVSVTPDINAVSTLMLLASMLMIGVSLLLQNRNNQDRNF